MNDPEVIRAAERFVRVIVRRPHAYFFLRDQVGRGLELGGSNELAIVLPDGREPPLPGIYLLSDDGSIANAVALAGAGARESLIAALTGAARH